MATGALAARSTHNMLGILTSLFCLWCAWREIHRSKVPAPGFGSPAPITKSYLALVLSLAVIFAWPPVHTWHFERFMFATATALADNRRARGHCNTIVDTMLGPEMLAVGHANPQREESRSNIPGAAH